MKLSWMSCLIHAYIIALFFHLPSTQINSRRLLTLTRASLRLIPFRSVPFAVSEINNFLMHWVLVWYGFLFILIYFAAVRMYKTKTVVELSSHKEYVICIGFCAWFVPSALGCVFFFFSSSYSLVYSSACLSSLSTSSSLSYEQSSKN